MNLPITDEFGFYEVRFESIGGLGAHVAGQIIAEAIVFRMGFNAAHFSSYGSEKKGSPIKSFIRICSADQEIRRSSPVETPHIIVVFHDALLANAAVLAGLRQGGSLIINTVKSLAQLKPFLGGAMEIADIYTLDALSIAVEEKSRVNTALMGAVCKVSGFLDLKSATQVLAEKFEKKHPKAVEPNRRTIQRGFDEVKLLTRASATVKKGELGLDVARPGPLYGYKTAPIGGVIIDPGNTILNDMSASRVGFLPQYHRDKCIHCGLCDLACPDHCFVWETQRDEKGTEVVRLQGIDYLYCKGCMRCVDSCPSVALTKEREQEGWAQANRVEAFPEISK